MRWLELELLGNTLLRWTIAVAVVAAAFTLILLVRRVLVVRLTVLAARTETHLDDLAVDLLRRTRRWSVLLATLYLGARLLVLHPRIDRALEVLAIVALIVQGGIWTMAFVDSWFARYRRERLAADPGSAGTLEAIGFFAKVALWSVVLLLGLDNLGVDVTALVAGLGIGGIAIALAAQNILGDLFSSLSIVVDKPFVVGETITVGEYTGTVERIGLKTTRLRSVGGEQLVFSNGDLLGSRIRNWGRLVERRVLATLGVRYDTPADQLETIPQMLQEAVAADERLRFDRAHFKAFGASSLDFELVYWILSPEYGVFMECQQGVNLRILRRFEAAGIGFPFPTRTLHVESLPRATAVEPAASEQTP